MEAKAAAAGLQKFFTSLVVTVLFPLQWMRMLKVARRHEGTDKNAAKKVLTGAVVGLLLAGFGVVQLLGFQDNAVAGTYETLDGRLSFALGNEQYNEHVAAADAAAGRITLANEKLAAGEDPELWEANRQAAIEERNEEQAKADALHPNHILYGTVHEFVMAQDDSGAKSTIANRGAIDFPSLDDNADSAFAKKDAAVSDMQGFLLWFVWPGLVGALFAPLVFAVGHVLNNAFVPSETVGYKRYPAGAMALFLLLGGFGIPALLFAAWSFQDMSERSVVGQIAL